MSNEVGQTVLVSHTRGGGGRRREGEVVTRRKRECERKGERKRETYRVREIVSIKACQTYLPQTPTYSCI